MNQVPRDARLISLILASKGIDDTDKRVLQQLLDFSYRYTADVLQSAQVLADHRSGPAKIEKEDVELAIQMRKRTEFHEAPPRDYLASLAHELNVLPLPILPESFEVVRLPPPHQRLAEVNFDIVPDTGLVFSDSEDSEEEDEVEEEQEEQEQDADGSDEEMEEVDIQPVALAPAPPPRELDEDYDD